MEILRFVAFHLGLFFGDEKGTLGKWFVSVAMEILGSEGLTYYEKVNFI
jgi:hypothetical protein